MRMFVGKDFTKGLARLEWKRPEDVVLRFKSSTPEAVKASRKKGQAKSGRSSARKSRVRYAP